MALEGKSRYNPLPQRSVKIVTPVRHVSNLSSKPRSGDFTPSLGRLFWCLTTLAVKKFILMSNLKLPVCNLSPLLLVLPDMETKLILRPAQLFLKTGAFPKMDVEFSLRGGAGSQTLLRPTLVTLARQDSPCSSRWLVFLPQHQSWADFLQWFEADAV